MLGSLHEKDQAPPTGRSGRGVAVATSQADGAEDAAPARASAARSRKSMHSRLLAVPRPMPDRAALEAEVQDLDLAASAADPAGGLVLLDAAALAELTHPGAAHRRLNISRLG